MSDHLSSQSRGKRSVTSALPIRLSSRQVPEFVTPFCEQRARKCSGALELEDEIFALIGCLAAEAAKSETGRTGNRLGHQIAWIDGLHTLHQGQGGISGRNRDVQALVRIDRRADRRLDRGVRRRQARPEVREVDAFVRAGTSLDVHADRCRLDIEHGARNDDRYSRRIECDGAVWPARPQYVGDIGGAEYDQHAKHHQRCQQWAVPSAALASSAAPGRRRTMLCERCQFSAPAANRPDYATPRSQRRDFGIYHLLRIGWRRPRAFATDGGL